MLRKHLREEEFFFWYHYKSPPWEIRKHLSVIERKWFIDRFIQQKEQEAAEMEKSKRR